MSDQIEWKVMNPTAQYDKIIYKQPQKIDAVDNKKIGLFWNGKVDGYKLLDNIGVLLNKKFKDVKIMRYDLCIGIGDEKIRQLAEECDAVIAGVGD
jgi:hypothetical protein